MSDDTARTPRRSQRGYWLLIAVQWLLLTLALTGTMTRSALAMADYVSPNLSPGWLAVAAFVMGLLLGMTVISPRVLFPLVMLMVGIASALFGAIIYLPAWQGTLFRNTTFANYAQQQALLFTIWTAVPALVGALAAYLLAGGIRDAVERRRTGAGADALPWWERSEGRRDIGT